MTRYLIAGAGVSGQGTARLLRVAGLPFDIVDDDPAKTDILRSNEISFADYDTVVTSPGWRPDSPLLVAAKEAGCEVIGDVELCYRLDKQGVFGPPRDWLVVTGTNGKTTTTGMLAAIMQEAAHYTGKKAVACGNIGVAVGDALIMEERADVLVAELSSFQLHWSEHLTPDAAVLLNLAEDHIDWHGSFEAYAQAKAKVFTASTAVAGIDDERVRDYAPAHAIGFTVNEPQAGQVGIIDGGIVSRIGDTPVRITAIEGIEPPGRAGVLDALAASAIAITRGAAPEQIDRALHSYTVAGHRGAVVHKDSDNDIVWIDNSKATNPHAADSALKATTSKIVWVAGGQLKGADVSSLIQDHGEKFRAVALLGVDGLKIKHAVETFAPSVPTFYTDSTDPVEAMEQVVNFATEQALPGDAVILAPAAASLDMYTGMAQRGNLFVQAARATKEKANE